MRGRPREGRPLRRLRVERAAAHAAAQRRARRRLARGGRLAAQAARRAGREAGHAARVRRKFHEKQPKFIFRSFHPTAANPKRQGAPHNGLGAGSRRRLAVRGGADGESRRGGRVATEARADVQAPRECSAPCCSKDRRRLSRRAIARVSRYRGARPGGCARAQARADRAVHQHEEGALPPADSM